jgi:hypothetical protein
MAVAPFVYIPVHFDHSSSFSKNNSSAFLNISIIEACRRVNLHEFGNYTDILQKTLTELSL